MPRVRRNFCLSLDTDARIRSRAASTGDGKSRTVEQLVDEAEGNFQRLRCEMRERLNAIMLQAEIVRTVTRHPSALEAVAVITRAAGELAGMLARN